MKVIINADDFGYSKEVNQAIENAINQGCISSSTIIANSPFFSEAVCIAKKYNNISFGVHLNLIEFVPLSSNTIFNKYGLIDENGNFRYGAIFGIKKFSKELKNAIKIEWDMQIKKVIDSGVCISHVDSHQHTHSIYELEDVLIDILKKYKLNKTRKNIYLRIPTILRIRRFDRPIYNENSNTINKRNNVLKKIINHLFVLPTKSIIWSSKIKKYANISDFLFSYQVFLQEYKTKSRLYVRKTIEIECHPGLRSNDEETRLLMADSLRQICPYYELITFKEL